MQRKRKFLVEKKKKEMVKQQVFVQTIDVNRRGVIFIGTWHSSNVRASFEPDGMQETRSHIHQPMFQRIKQRRVERVKTKAHTDRITRVIQYVHTYMRALEKTCAPV